MFRLLPVFLCFLVLFSAPLRAEEFVADSVLKAATVYTNRATLTRRAVLDLPAGAHKVVFKGLSASLLSDSLRAEGQAAATVTFGALAHKMVQQTELTAPREKGLNDQLELLQDQRKVIEVEKQALNTKRSFLDSLGKHAVLRTNEDIAEIDLQPDQWTAAAETLHTGMAEILKAGLSHDVRLRTLDRQIQKVRNELNQMRTGQRSTYQVTVPLEVKAPTRLTIELSYQVPNASWSPLYDARLETETGALALLQYGAVHQNTGEDWTDIALTLSTAQPHRGAGLPPLQPMWVNLWENKSLNRVNFSVAASQVASRAPLAQDFAEGMLAEELSQPEPAQFAQAQIETGGFVSEYIIPGPSTVMADGTESKLMIGPFETESKLQIHVKPQLSTDAFLVANVKLKGESPILPGKVSLFRDGAYVGQAYLPLLRPDEESKLAFGVDDQVSVKRHVMKDEKGDKGVIAKGSLQERHFITEIQNLHDRPVDILVFETTPVAGNNKIKIEILERVTTAGYEEDVFDVKGQMSWTQHLEAKEKAKIGLGWKVIWPKDSNISGL